MNARLEIRLIRRLNLLSFVQFEALICHLLTAMGYTNPEPLGRRYFKGSYPDQGADLITTVGAGPTRIPVFVMLKQFRARPVQKRYAMELLGNMTARKVPRGVIVTTSSFPMGTTVAAAHSPATIDLIDGKKLVSLLVRHRLGVKPVGLLVKLDEPFFSSLTASNSGLR